MTAELLVLVTQSFPFGSYVDFLEEEIEYLAGEFEQVRIAPFAPTGTEQALPANVTLDLGLAATVETRRQRIAAGLRSRDGRGLAMGDLRRYRQPRRRPEALGRLLAASGLASETARWATGLGVLPPATVAMTVWLGAPTVGVAQAGLRTVSRVHGGDLYTHRAPNEYLPLQAKALSGCTMLYPVSDAGRSDLAGRFPAIAPRLETRRLGVGGVSTIAEPSRDGVLRVVSCSSLTPVKRPLLLVDVVSELAALEPGVEWHHFGSGPLLAEVTQRAASLPSSCRLVMHGHVPNLTVLEHYARNPVDVFLNVSSSEGVPVSMMEAISGGIPIVATNVGGVSEIVNERTGALVAADANAAHIASVVRSRAADAGDISVRQAIREEWEQSYSSRHNYGAFAAELASIARRTS